MSVCVQCPLPIALFISAVAVWVLGLVKGLGPIGRQAVSSDRRNARDVRELRWFMVGRVRIAAGRRPRPERGKLVRDPVLRQWVQDRLEKRWVFGAAHPRAAREFPDELERRVVHETIYQAIYRPERGGLRRDLPKVRRTGRQRRFPFGSFKLC